MNRLKRIVYKRRYVHSYMRYRCDKCDSVWKMYCEEGIEEGGKNHKPSPYAIKCPFCIDGIATDVSGLIKLPFKIKVDENISYFANKTNSDCGVSTFSKLMLKQMGE